MYDYDNDGFFLLHGITQNEYHTILEKLQAKYELNIKLPRSFNETIPQLNAVIHLDVPVENIIGLTRLNSIPPLIQSKTRLKFIPKRVSPNINKKLIDISIHENKTEQLIVDSYNTQFVIDISHLDSCGINISPLIYEFNNITKYDDYQHICSLAYLTSVYAIAGYKLEILTHKKKGVRNPDFRINGLTADVKVRQVLDIRAPFISRNKNQFKSTLAEDLCYSIGHSIQNRLFVGIKQAELLFVDLNSTPLSLMALWDDKHSMAGQIPEPKKYRVIFYCYPQLEGQRKESAFCATYIDFDPLLWEFIKLNQDKIVHTRHTGK